MKKVLAALAVIVLLSGGCSSSSGNAGSSAAGDVKKIASGSGARVSEVEIYGCTFIVVTTGANYGGIDIEKLNQNCVPTKK